ncbi:MAG TPA: tRNA pseudouridine(55) synthase TruB [Gemmataceae bacterium]|nr:tRNA pseudouridine(55) synthase TruB [Gemmataceae bacterium]
MAQGLLVLDKPQGISSRQALDRAAMWFPRKTKIGHAGTLDPLATGVLVLAIGQATRLVEYVQAMPKMYRTRIRLGAKSDTDDAGGTITPNPTTAQLAETTIRAALDRFIGEVEQIPPAYSAARVEGQRAYDRARRGDEVTLAPRRVRIDRIDLLSYAWPDLVLEIHCGKGTYIRSIARDLGAALGVGGYVAELRRLSIGAFTLDQAVTLHADPETARQKLLPITMAVSGLRAVRVSPNDAQRLRNGLSISAAGEGEVAVLDQNGQLLAMGRVENGLLRPEKVLQMTSDQ